MERLSSNDTRKPTANMGFAIAGVPFFADTNVQGESSVLRMKFSAKTPRHRKPLKRHLQAQGWKPGMFLRTWATPTRLRILSASASAN